MIKAQLEDFGWVAVPRDRTNIPTAQTVTTQAINVDFKAIWPQTEAVKKAEAHVKPQLPAETYNHSLRVYCYGHTIVTQHFPEWISVAKDRFCETFFICPSRRQSD